MSLTEIWSTSRLQLQGKHIQQIIAISGDGRLLDGNSTSYEFREFLGRVDSELLKRYAEEALLGRFEGSGLALQDIVNEIGRRLSFKVVNGRYRGVSGQIGFDGLWRSGEGLGIVVEVKTTDAYRIDLDIPAGYRRELIRSAEISDDKSSLLIVVGRQDTGDLEAQIRGSRHAWDVRLISVDALLRLLKVRGSVDDPSIATKISQILIPREYTRVDGIIDVVFSAAEETLRTESVVDPADDEVDELVASKQKKFVPANFHALCIQRIERALGQVLVRQSPSIYKSADASVAVVCSISREYGKPWGAGYWFAYHPYYNDTFEGVASCNVVFGCGSANALLMVPFAAFRPLLDGLHKTERDDRYYWHVRIDKKSDRYWLQRRAGFEPVDLTNYFLK